MIGSVFTRPRHPGPRLKAPTLGDPGPILGFATLKQKWIPGQARNDVDC